MSDNGFLFWSARRLRQAYLARQLSPVEVMKAALERAESVQTICKPISEFFTECALDTARKAETRYGSSGDDPRIFEGVGLAVKESYALCGSRRTGGSLIFKDRRDETTDVYIQRLLDHGCIPIVKTTTPEFSLTGVTWSRLHGTTRNPWNPSMTCGGSSGGSGVALATGISPLATGSDIGGSIRIPAAACGVFGYKPPYGRNPQKAYFNLDYYSHSGPMARSVTDIIDMQNCTVGRDPRDIASLPAPPPHANGDADLEGLRVAFSVDLCSYEVAKDVRANLLHALDLMKQAGASVEEVDLGWSADVPVFAQRYLHTLWGVSVRKFAQEAKDLLCSYSLRFAEITRTRNIQDLSDCNKFAWDLYADFGPMMERYDIFVCPTNATTEVPADYGFADNGYRVDGADREGDEIQLWMTSPFNMLSRLPVLSAPTGFGSSGVPTAMQMVAKAYDEDSVFRAGLGYEALLPWLFDDSHRPETAYVSDRCFRC